MTEKATETKVKKKSDVRPKISDKTVLKLWVKAGGRCEYRHCNQILYEDGLTYADLNKSYIAHIYGYKPGSARFDIDKSPKLAKDFSNLMLLCDGCHRKIDREEKDKHPAEVLIKMKKEHEDRIEHMTGINASYRTDVIFYNAKIGSFNPPRDIETIKVMLAESGNYPHKDIITLNADGATGVEDNTNAYWQYENKSLEDFFQKKVVPLMATSDHHLSIFPFAPMPLLIKLGTLLGDKQPAAIYQYHREPAGWQWPESGDETKFCLITPVSKIGLPVLNISLSAKIDETRIKSLFPNQELSTWTLTIENPKIDFLKSEKSLGQFREIARKAFAEIKAAHGHDSELHIFPAMPVSTAVEFGRVWMPKVDLPMHIYDGREEFKITITINRQ